MLPRMQKPPSLEDFTRPPIRRGRDSQDDISRSVSLFAAALGARKIP